ncbi:MAG TPA: hypothetical protein DCY27_14860 [Desulfobacterales bacterium]|nr:hypothetical protein [Desulfobacterales bacterium]
MPIIFVKDNLRTRVEAATGGEVTVLYDDKGYPSCMNVIPKFMCEDIDASLGAGVHPAFVVDGVEKAEIFVGQYQAIVKDSRAVCLPGVDPATSMNFDNALLYCKNKGQGWHLMSNAEWAALAFWCWKNSFQPRGNTNYGRSYATTYETGRRVDGAAPGVTTGTPRTYTGSGPAAWRHDNSWTGIADLVGNVWEWVGGLRLNAGEIQILQDNNAADNTKDQSAASALWKAILASDGSLVNPGTAGTCKYDSVNAGTTGNVGAPQLDDVIDNSNAPASGDDGYTYVAFQSLAADAGITAPALLKRLLLFPHASSGLNGALHVRNYEERLPVRGGGWGVGANAGLFHLNLNDVRSNADTFIGFRPAFVS